MSQPPSRHSAARRNAEALLSKAQKREQSFKLEQDVMRTLDLPVLALVPVMNSDAERRLQRWRTIVLNVAGSAVLIGSVLFVVVWSLRA